MGIRSYVSEPDRGRRDWSKDPEARAPVYGNRRRMRGRRGRRLMRQRGERIERSFAHLYDTGGMRRTHLRGHTNILKRLRDSCGWLQSRARHASSDRDRHAARAAGPRGRCSCDVRGAHGRRPTSAHHDFVVASTHPGRARSARVTGHVCRQLVSGDHLHHGLLYPDLINLADLRKEDEAGRLTGLGEIGVQYAGIAADDPRLDPFYALAEEFDVPVSIHHNARPVPVSSFALPSDILNNLRKSSPDIPNRDSSWKTQGFLTWANRLR